MQFIIDLHKKDQVLLEQVNNYLGIGRIYNLGPLRVQYEIQC